MLNAIYIGLSGLDAYSRGLQTISNNVANLNSSGFKEAMVHFSDDAGGNESTGRSGSGVQYDGSGIDFAQGELRHSDNPLDLAIDGSGFLVLLDHGQTSYARTGSFTLNSDGQIVLRGTGKQLAVLNPDGQARTIDVNASRTDAPKPTSTIMFADNLSSSATTAKVSDIAVYDTSGGKHVWQVQLAKTTADATSVASNDWNVTVTDEAGRTIGTSVLKFVGGAVDPSSAKLTITDNINGSGPQNVVLDFSSGVTSYSSGSTSTLRASAVDGHAIGALTTVTVDDEGQLKLAYSNGESRQLGAVALANFSDAESLVRAGDGLFTAGAAGRPELFTSGADGKGKIMSKELEASNVDLAKEFGDLILIQRGYQASSQVISATNDMIQQLFGIRGQG